MVATKIGARIKAIRMSLLPKMTIERLAEISGIPARTLQDIENGVTKQPGFENISKIASGLKVSLDELASDASQKPSDSDLTLGEAKILDALEKRFPVTPNPMVELLQARSNSLPEEFWQKWPDAQPLQKAFALFFVTRDPNYLEGVKKEWVSSMMNAIQSYGLLPQEKTKAK